MDEQGNSTVDEPPEDDHPMSLQPGIYPSYDHVMHGPPDTDVRDVYVQIASDEGGHAVTCIPYDLSDLQKEMLEAGGHMRMMLWQHPMPPVALSVEGPFCTCHADEMAWDLEDGGWHCQHQEVIGGDVQQDPEGEVRSDFSPAEDDRDDPPVDPGD